MHADDGLVDIGDGLFQRADQSAELVRHRVTDGVRNVDRPRSGIDHRLHHFGEEIRFRAGGVLGGKLDIVTEPAPEPHRVRRHLDDFILTLLQFMVAVQFRGRQKYMNARRFRLFESARGGLDVLFQGAGQPRHGRTSDLVGDLLDRFKIAGRRHGKTRLDDIHFQ